ncbi:hypothetical protein QR98_0091630 [Sarcoptes scabiei]|uniref:Uncharacterized protein n=1 Tax=Sarcoptes scabiei TaxID=52283 RepID=A0A132AHY4_SARSC|nr:hypothetical protein QR98_0091630 [Sarcoptes scabiei]
MPMNKNKESDPCPPDYGSNMGGYSAGMGAATYGGASSYGGAGMNCGNGAGYGTPMDMGYSSNQGIGSGSIYPLILLFHIFLKSYFHPKGSGGY